MELIKVAQGKIGETEIQTVNARDLHGFLEVGKVFAAWVQERIEQFGFIENQDFVVISESGKNPLGGRPAKDYHLSLDMAKELSMVERNEKGKQARLYFIECERRAKLQVTDSPEMQVARGLLAAAEMLKAKDDQIAALEPKAAALDRIASTDGLACMTDAAKVLGVKRKDLITFLHAHRWIYRRGNRWVGHEEKTRQGLLDHKFHAVIGSDGHERQEPQVYVTPKGVAKLSTTMGRTLQ
jgi:anti-repressor protein